MDQQTTQNIPVRTAKDVVIAPLRSNYLDRKIIATSFYNSFNYSKLPQKYKHIKLSMGITSPNTHEGKTLVAANLAISFAMGYKRKTVLVDLNLNNPQIHKIFGIMEEPGLVEALHNHTICLTQTRIDQLYVLPSGRYMNHSLGLKDLTALRDVIYSLEREFEFVIVDMGSILPIDDFPALFANEVDGLMLVVDTRKTKRADIDEIFHYIDDKQIFGFVLNRMKDGHRANGKRRRR